MFVKIEVMNEESVYNLKGELVGFILVPATTPKLIKYKNRFFIYNNDKSQYDEYEAFDIMYKTA
jgi:hypothetical protein